MILSLHSTTANSTMDFNSLTFPGKQYDNKAFFAAVKRKRSSFLFFIKTLSAPNKEGGKTKWQKLN